MWVKALDMLLDKLRVCGVDFSKVVALSGTAQVYFGMQNLVADETCLKFYTYLFLGIYL